MTVFNCGLFICLLALLGSRNIVGFPFTGNSIDSPDGELIDLSHLGTSIFGEPDEAVGKKLETWKPEDGNPEEMGSYGEGDILVPSDQQGRNGLSTQSARWPGGVIPFVIAGNFNPRELNLIEQAFNEYHTKTCIKFIPRTNEPDFISIENSATGCWSSVGRMGRKQTVNLQTPSCMTKVGTAIHELLHAVGFLHEQNRFDRDEFVDIQWNNIPNDVRGNFEKADAGTTTAFDVPYDYGSVMHYSAKAFSNNGQNTIVPRISDPLAMQLMGQRDAFSLADIEKINRMYGCPTSQGGQSGPGGFNNFGPGPSPNNFGPGPNNFGPGPSSNNFGPGPNNFGPGPNNFGPGPNNFGPGPSSNNFGPGPNNFGPGPNNFGPGPASNNFGPGSGPNNFGPGPAPNNFGPGPNSFGFRPNPNGFRPFPFRESKSVSENIEE